MYIILYVETTINPRSCRNRALSRNLPPWGWKMREPPDRSGGSSKFLLVHQFESNFRTSMKLTALPLKRPGSMEAVLVKPSA